MQVPGNNLGKTLAHLEGRVEGGGREDWQPPSAGAQKGNQLCLKFYSVVSEILASVVSFVLNLEKA